MTPTRGGLRASWRPLALRLLPPSQGRKVHAPQRRRPRRNRADPEKRVSWRARQAGTSTCRPVIKATTPVDTRERPTTDQPPITLASSTSSAQSSPDTFVPARRVSSSESIPSPLRLY